MRPEIRLTPPRRARRRMAGLVWRRGGGGGGPSAGEGRRARGRHRPPGKKPLTIPWMLSRRILRWRLAPPFPSPLPPFPGGREWRVAAGQHPPALGDGGSEDREQGRTASGHVDRVSEWVGVVSTARAVWAAWAGGRERRRCGWWRESGGARSLFVLSLLSLVARLALCSRLSRPEPA
jgi:hypothetical protein